LGAKGQAKSTIINCTIGKNHYKQEKKLYAEKEYREWKIL
jgi:hypothetical protein